MGEMQQRSDDGRTRRRIVGAVVGAGLIGVFSMSAAGAGLLDSGVTGLVGLNGGVEKCVTVVVPQATATVNARLTVSAAGATSTSQSSTVVSTGLLGTVRVCVLTDVNAHVVLNAAAVANGVGRTSVNLDASVAAEAAVKVTILANGKSVL